MIAALLQARTGSQRLPNKVLKELPEGSGVSMLARIIRRLKSCQSLDDIIVVTPDEPCMVIARKEGVKCSRLIQDKRDVLAEFHHAAKNFNVDTIVRVTADCPCISWQLIDRIVSIHLEGGVDLTYNRNDNLCRCVEVDGLDTEVFSFEALDKTHSLATEDSDREHVTRWMYENLKTEMVECGWYHEKDIKLSVDTQDDFDRISTIYEELGDDFTMKDLREYIEKDEK